MLGQTTTEIIEPSAMKARLEATFTKLSTQCDAMDSVLVIVLNNDGTRVGHVFGDPRILAELALDAAEHMYTTVNEIEQQEERSPILLLN